MPECSQFQWNQFDIYGETSAFELSTVRFISFFNGDMPIFLFLFYAYTWASSRQNVSSGVSNQARHKPACSATAISYSLEISAIESRDIILSKQRTTKAQIRLRGADLRLCCSHMT